MDVKVVWVLMVQIGEGLGVLGGIRDHEGLQGVHCHHPWGNAGSQVLPKEGPQWYILPLLDVTGCNERRRRIYWSSTFNFYRTMALKHEVYRNDWQWICQGSQLVHLPLQSFIRTMPKMWSSALSMLIGSPSWLPGPTRNAISSSKSNNLQGPNTGGWAATDKEKYNYEDPITCMLWFSDVYIIMVHVY